MFYFNRIFNLFLNFTKIHDLEYSRYLKEVVSVLESDSKFKQMIENASVDDIKVFFFSITSRLRFKTLFKIVR
jgi:ubiquinone/menaquinone biosynthesis C-methylase UbiE